LLKIPYYPGCTLSTVAKDFDTSAKDSAIKMGFEITDLKQWNCCGATYPLTPDNLMALSAPAKVLANAEKEGKTLTTLCSVCYNVLKRTNTVLKKDSEKLATINEFMEEQYSGDVDVAHYLEILRDKIGFDKVAEAVTRPLKGIRTAAYYGCMLLRPFEDMGIDNSESPTIMEDLLKALGAEPVFFPDRVECCGAHLAMDKPDIVTRLSGNVIASAMREGAEVIVTTCPLCQYNLENTQSESDGTALPIVYFTQLLGLALGQDEEALGFDKNKFSPLPILRDKELL